MKKFWVIFGFLLGLAVWLFFLISVVVLCLYVFAEEGKDVDPGEILRVPKWLYFSFPLVSLLKLYKREEMKWFFKKLKHFF